MATRVVLVRSVMLVGMATGAVPDLVGVRTPVGRSRRAIVSCARLVAVLTLLAAAILSTPEAHAQDDEEHQGLQAGWAIDDKGNVNFTSSFSLQNRYMHEAEASW